MAARLKTGGRLASPPHPGCRGHSHLCTDATRPDKRNPAPPPQGALTLAQNLQPHPNNLSGSGHPFQGALTRLQTHWAGWQDSICKSHGGCPVVPSGTTHQTPQGLECHIRPMVRSLSISSLETALLRTQTWVSFLKAFLKPRRRRQLLCHSLCWPVSYLAVAAFPIPINLSVKTWTVSQTNWADSLRRLNRVW